MCVCVFELLLLELRCLGTMGEPVMNRYMIGTDRIDQAPCAGRILSTHWQRLAVNNSKLVLDHPLWPCGEIKKAQSLGRAFGYEASVGLAEVIERHKSS